ncbi:DUF3953 domain-containing protein [Oceanobacillus locisalsi]|uniref:DUF3953 domain-containing protein n=1 Tax=Oceanobacillus locisalsi TaxID=546107 RepID=A0ABW3NF21_9BACI
MVQKGRILLSIVIIVLAGYSMITQNFGLAPYYLFLLGVVIVITGGISIQQSKKDFWGYICIIASLFVFYVSVQGFLFH